MDNLVTKNDQLNVSSTYFLHNLLTFCYISPDFFKRVIKMNKLLAASMISATVLMTGCASIIKGSTQTLTFTSVPDSAKIEIKNRAGQSVNVGQTPTTVSLKKGAGYFKPEEYQITFSKDGFTPKTVAVKGTISGWYFGNIIFGGLIGLLAVDPATGAMYSFTPEDINAVLEANNTEKMPKNDKALAVVFTDQVPEDVMARAIQIKN